MSMSPPFRADHVGSLLRPAAIKAARAGHAKHEIDDAALAAVEDTEIARAVARQESLGLKSVTDGEYRRYAWQTDFLAKLDGATMAEMTLPLPDGKTAKMLIPRIVGKLGFSGHPMIDHWKFLAAHAKAATPKLSIPSPNMLISILRDWRQGVSEQAYPDMATFRRDIGAVYTKAVRAIGEAGCKYLQLDDCNLSYLCDPAQVEKAKARGLDPKALLDTFVGLINEAIAERPKDMTVAVHICRGNFRSTWLASGGYEAIAEAIFNRTKVDGFFLEYDSDRAGGFEPLRFVPKDKTIVLGLVSSKTGTPEPKDLIKRRIDEAAKFAPLDQLCLSPQCGFASTEDGNVLSEDEQWAKLGFVVEVAREVWGTA
jgi:5-methyltetrahydropteroyltriglutamate--homocysteine methyltransferase